MGLESNIPEDWVESTIGKVTVVESGGTPSTKNSSYWGDEIPWITPRDLSSFKGVFIEKGERSISIQGLENSSAKLLPKNTILFSSRAPIGYVAIAQNETATNQGFKNLICDEVNSHFKYFYYLMKYKADFIERLSSGSTFSEASRTLIKSIELKLPPLQEQKAIAKVLTAFDDKIELLQEQNKTLETIAQTIFKEWFGKYKTGDKLPEGWRVGSLRDLGKIICGKTPSKADKEKFGGSIPFVKIPDMHNKMFIVKTSDSLTNKGISTQKNKIIKKNSICVSCIATVGLVSITTKDSQTNQQINSIIPFNQADREFIYFKVKGLYNFLQDIGSGGTATLNVNTTSFSNIEIIIPDNIILKSYNNIASPIFEKVLDNYIQIQSLTKTRDTLLPKLMSGQVRVNNIKQTVDA